MVFCVFAFSVQAQKVGIRKRGFGHFFTYPFTLNTLREEGGKGSFFDDKVITSVTFDLGKNVKIICI